MALFKRNMIAQPLPMVKEMAIFDNYSIGYLKSKITFQRYFRPKPRVCSLSSKVQLGVSHLTESGSDILSQKPDL